MPERQGAIRRTTNVILRRHTLQRCSTSVTHTNGMPSRKSCRVPLRRTEENVEHQFARTPKQPLQSRMTLLDTSASNAKRCCNVRMKARMNLKCYICKSASKHRGQYRCRNNEGAEETRAPIHVGVCFGKADSFGT